MAERELTDTVEAEVSVEELREYWNEERRAEARPKPLKYVDRDQFIRDPGPTGEAMHAAPHRAEEAEQFERRKDSEDDSCPATKVTDPTTYPNTCNGKLFFDWKGSPYVGSAGSINLEILLTAGHNVYDEGEWSSNFLYYPAYPALGRSWGWSRAAVFTAWQNNEDYKYDYAMLKVSSSLSPVGSWGWAYGYPKTSWKSFGYPAQAPYPGNQMYQTTGSYTGSGNPMAMDNNDMTPGSSGGNWILTLNGKQVYANGVNSFGYDSEPCNMYSPYFDASFAVLHECATTGTCK